MSKRQIYYPISIVCGIIGYGKAGFIAAEQKLWCGMARSQFERKTEIPSLHSAIVSLTRENTRFL